MENVLDEKQVLVNQNDLYRIKGTFTYIPSYGYKVTEAGYHKLTVTFHPDDSKEYEEVEGTSVIKVFKVSPRVQWWYPVSVL